MHKSNERGFSLIEIVVVFSLICVLCATSCIGNYVKEKEKAKEAEVKCNCHTIQISLERYMTDNNEYPHYLLGGDIDGWLNWHAKWDGVNDLNMSEERVASNDRVDDPLVEYDYITSYPFNPFVGDGRIITRQTNVDGTDNQGEGDPRFGYKGNVMGQGLDDMSFFRGANHPGPFHWSEIETRRTLDRGDWMNVPEAFKSSSPVDTQMYYVFGGFTRPPESGGRGKGKQDVIYTFWPGNFFYKATSDQVISREGWAIPVPNANIGGHYNRYILGGYGAEGTVGVDVIRTIWWNPDGERLSWKCPPPFDEDCFDLGYELFNGNFHEPGGLPEVFGGGDERNGPWNPYNQGGKSADDFVYGAPDGVPDGVILVLTNGSEVERFQG